MTTPLHCDVLVLGGGPAGTAAALALQARGLAALVIEKTSYESAKPGETLLADVHPFLEVLGVWRRFAARGASAAAPVVPIWGESRAHLQASELDLHRPGWQVDRMWFDAMLAQAAETAGALIYCGVRPIRVERVRTGWKVLLRSGGAETSVHARYLVDATGRVCWLARRMGAVRRRVDNLVGLMAGYTGAPSDAALLVESAQEGWWYSVPLPGERMVAVYLTDADLVPTRRHAACFRASLATTELTRERLAPLGESSIRLVSAETSVLERCVGQRWVAVGDAAFALDPLSGSGIRRALETGFLAAEGIVAASGGDRSVLAEYQESATERFAAQLVLRRHYYRLEHRWPTSAFWRRRHEHSGAAA